jgi:branched-chain amino acid transport system substrate-binding protein
MIRIGVAVFWLAAWAALFNPALAGDTLRVAIIEPLSGPFANIGTSSLKHWQAEADRVNAQGGVLGRRVELMPLDNKSSPQETTIQLQAAIDQGVRYVAQAAGSNNAHALTDAVARHNTRNPKQPVLYVNFGALDPALTDEKCHFWHFRFVPHGHMIMNAMTDMAARSAQSRRVFLINQDYVWGHSVAKDSRDMLAARRTDIEIVGDDLHPIGKVKDFAPYVAKIAAAKSDAVITGNWGNDLALLIKAANDTGLKSQFYAPLAGLQGTPTMLGEAGAERVRAALFWHANIEGEPLVQYALAYRARYKEDWNWLPIRLAMESLVAAMQRAQSVEPLAVALALENLRLDGPTGELWMRPDDHQLMMPIYQAVFARVGQRGVRYDAEGTGLGWRTEGKLDTRDNIPPVRCTVSRPK